MEEQIRNIEDAETFEEIAEIKERAYRYDKAAGNNYDNILSSLYKDPTHFMYELLQNAEDVCATKVCFNLLEDRLIFIHNGKAFDLRDVRGITGINDNFKRNDITKIGRFGIGFKAVFSVCDSPEIYSDEFNFRIRHFNVPEKIARGEEYRLGLTYIVLPFKQGIKDQLFNLIEGALNSISTDILVFLKHITQIDFSTPNAKGFFEKKEKQYNWSKGVFYITEIISIGGVKAKYYLFKKPLSFNKDLSVSIAYSYDEETGEIVQCGDSTKIVVYFPTENDSFLKFKVHGPYQTTPTRESVPETPDNLKILEETTYLFRESLFCLKEIGLFSVEFLLLLPLINRFYSGDKNIFYEHFFNVTKDCLSKELMLPTNDSKFTKAENALLARGPITDLLSTEDNAKLFGKRTNWLSLDITRDKTPALVSCLVGILKIKEIDFDSFLGTVDKEFLEKKDNRWLIDFYSKANNNITTIKQKYLSKDIIKTESGKFVPIASEAVGAHHKHNIYLPSKLITNKDEMVNVELYNDENVRTFFRNVGIEEMDILENIRTQWISTIRESKDEEEHYENLFLLYLEYSSMQPDDKKELRNIIKQSNCILYRDDQNRISFAQPSSFMMAHGISKILYDGCPDVLFLNDILDKAVQEDSGFYDFLKSLGVCSGLKLIHQSGNLSYDDKKLLLKNASYTWYSLSDSAYQIFKIDYILSHINKERSVSLWKEINTLPESFFKGELTWSYYSSYHRVEFDAYFIKTLQKAQWLYDAENNLVSPEEIYEDNVQKYYGNGTIIRYLSFKSNALDGLPQNERQKLELIKDISIEELLQWKEERDKLSVAPVPINVIPEEQAVDIEDSQFRSPFEGKTAEEITKTDNNESHENEYDLEQILNGLYDDVDIPDTIVDKIVAKRVANEAELDGDLGERFVLSSLKKKYIEDGYKIYNETLNGFSASKNEKTIDVLRQNTENRNQKGYDITQSIRGEIFEYIEVKSKKSGDKESFKVSGLQWQFAKKLYEEGKGEKHFVYVVSYVREPLKTKITKVSNPYKAWLDGNLDASPIGIKY